jgi:hypothetical protein
LTTQAQIFQVLSDLAREEGGWAPEVRELLGRDILGWELASCWTSGSDQEVERYHRYLVGQSGYEGVLATVELEDRPAGQFYQWYWSAGDHRLVSSGSMKDAQDAADAELRERGIVLLTPPLAQLGARLLELGEWPGFVEDMLGSSRPERSFDAVGESHGEDRRVRELLALLGWHPLEQRPWTADPRSVYGEGQLTMARLTEAMEAYYKARERMPNRLWASARDLAHMTHLADMPFPDPQDGAMLLGMQIVLIKRQQEWAVGRLP